MAHIAKALIHNPPVILAIENTGMCGSVALVCASHCIGEHSLQTKLTHSKRLLSSIEHLMDEAQINWKQIDAVAVSLGPGSFTGLRIGLSTAKGLSFAASVPLIGISTLEAMANQFNHAAYQICSVIDARKKEVYGALFRPERDGSISRLSEDMVISPKSLAAKILEPTLLVGDGAELYLDVFRETLGPNALFPSPHHSFPRATHIGYLALPLWEQKKFLDPASATPIYIRPSDAELHANKS